MELIGIEQARAKLGDLAGETTYIALAGRPAAAVLGSRHQTGLRADPVTLPDVAPHVVIDSPSGYRCTCGADEYVGTATRSFWRDAHQQAQAQLVLRAFTRPQLHAVLRRSTGNNWRATAAVELLIDHHYWLQDATFVAHYLIGTWTVDGDLVVEIDWDTVASAADRFSRAVDALVADGVDAKVIATLRQHEPDNVAHPLGGTSSELAVLRIAASIAYAGNRRTHREE
jgi:hypothetical protein